MDSTPKADDARESELLRLIRAGDEGALTALYREHHGNIYRFALQMCGSPALAEDVTQEVFIVLIRDTETFDNTRGSLNGFLLGVARNLVLRRLRRERFYVSVERLEDDVLSECFSKEEPFEDLFRMESIESVRRAVLALPERYREVVVLCELQELSYAEAAQVLGCAIGTVRSRLHRARALLIAKLRPARETTPTAAEIKSKRCLA